MKMSELKYGDRFIITDDHYSEEIFQILQKHSDITILDTHGSKCLYVYTSVDHTSPNQYGLFVSPRDLNVEKITMTTKKMFTAKEARQLSGKSVEEKVESLLEAVRIAANNKQRELRCGWSYKEDKDLWINGGYSKTTEWKQAKDILESLGFTVEFFYEDKQFVNMYTIIKW